MRNNLDDASASPSWVLEFQVTPPYQFYSMLVIEFRDSFMLCKHSNNWDISSSFKFFFINRIPLIRMPLPCRHYKHRNIKNLRFLIRLPLEIRYLLELWSYAQNRTPSTTKMIKTYKRALCSPNIWWTSNVHVHFYLNYRNYFATRHSISHTDNIT